MIGNEVNVLACCACAWPCDSETQHSFLDLQRVKSSLRELWIFCIVLKYFKTENSKIDIAVHTNSHTRDPRRIEAIAIVGHTKGTIKPASSERYQ
jgi:hypothetical protein